MNKFETELMKARHLCLTAKRHDKQSREHMSNIVTAGFWLGRASFGCHPKNREDLFDSAIGNLAFGDIDAALNDIHEILSNLPSALNELQAEFEAAHA